MGVYQEMRMLEKLADDPEAVRPIYEPNMDECDGSNELTGYRKIDAQECEKTIALFKKIQAGLSVSYLTSQTCGFMARITLFIRRQLLAQLNQANRRDNQGGDPLQNPIEIDVDLLRSQQIKKLEEIPIEFHNDDIFNNYLCKLEDLPIRYIVQDPTIEGEASVFYEKAAIEKWLQLKSISPITRKPLTSVQLMPRPDLQSIIDKRLEYYAKVSAEVFMRIVSGDINQLRGV
jgi:hypothetical protein